MANWKDLGEIPDSEDEALSDSQEIGQHALTIPAKLQLTTSDQDIWDFPGSQDGARIVEPNPEHDTLLFQATKPDYELSSPLSSINSEDCQLAGNDPYPARQQSEDKDDGRPGLVNVTFPPNPAKTPNKIVQNALTEELQRLNKLSKHRADHQSTVRFERSLRPRKPIQEHPYLLENAQYSHVLKSHGLKPWRIAREIGGEENDGLIGGLQDEDFQQDSQVAGDIRSRVSSPNRASSPQHVSLLEAFSSTPPERLAASLELQASSPRTGSVEETDNTSILEEDLPALQDLLARPQGPIKRNVPLSYSSARKRRRRNIIDSDPIEPISSPGTLIDASPSARSPQPALVRPFLIEPASSPAQELDQQATATSAVSERILVSSDDGDEQQNDTNSETETVSEDDAVTSLSRQIRGVLPASWLRLDRQDSRDNVQQRTWRRDRSRIAAEKDARRGVAQPRTTLPRGYAMSLTYDDLDEENPEMISNPMQPRPRLGLAELEFEPPSHSEVARQRHEKDDDDMSVVEDNSIDQMLPPSAARRRHPERLNMKGNKGHRRPSDSRNRGSKSNGIKAHQSRITQLPQNSDSGRVPSLRRVQQSSRTLSKMGSPRFIVPPELSILDTIPANAPRFLRIAARASRKKENQGRSSPKRKIIQLATEQDQLDAASVLHAWRSGSIRQRASITNATRPLHNPPAARSSKKRSFAMMSHNTVQNRVLMDTSRKFVRLKGSNGPVKYVADQRNPSKLDPKVGLRSQEQQSVQYRHDLRLAQLETEDPIRLAKVGFDTRKRFLDRLYKRSRPDMLASDLKTSSISSSADSWHPTTAFDVQSEGQEPPLGNSKRSARSRWRKTTHPKWIDINEPQYRQAKSPLSARETNPFGYQGAQEKEIEKKLLGLGPYGTAYTYDFGVVPAQGGTFFHETTLIGSGYLRSCMDLSDLRRQGKVQARASLPLKNHVLIWGSWDAEVSSELGLVLDSLAEHIVAHLSRQIPPEPLETTPVEAVAFVLRYTADTLAWDNGGHKTAFVRRMRQCIQNLNRRVELVVQSTQIVTGYMIDDFLQVYDRLLLMALLILGICRKDPNFEPEISSFEQLLLETAKVAASMLIKFGIESLQKTYMTLGCSTVREHGIPEASRVIHSWVMIIKVLDGIRVPGGCFWDVASELIAPDQYLRSQDARDFESVWERMFTLLPLFEFNESGVLIPGQRHRSTCDGWRIPHLLLKRVFQLYHSNKRQTAGFNNYCRALVGRCLHLVQEWGWRKCVSVVGQIFDFFGAQGLAHLRNEEVYESPSFLENLTGRPVLRVEAQDRCFHVFLKLVAVAILKSLEAGALKDVGNLVSRTIPNHDRQHNKEDKILACDIAALRNHHDLLCTLYWAAPAGYRPAATLVQNLVNPATSHKEACLVNLRAWTQLARFVIASDDFASSWKAFHHWRTAFFDQILQQYNAVRSIVESQLANLSIEASRSMSDQTVKSTIATNKLALMDILVASARASLDVMRCAPTLAAATFAVNLAQLRTIFMSFSTSLPETDWGILRASLTILDTFLTRIDGFKAQEESQQSESQIPGSAVADDALLVLEQEVSRSFFSMARLAVATRLSHGKTSLVVKLDQDECIEQIVKLSARLTSSFLNGGLMRLAETFNVGKFQLFDGSPRQLDLDSRKHLVLFMATLLEQGIEVTEEAEFSLFEIWALSLAKPRVFLRHEMQLARQLVRLEKPFVPKAIADLSCLLDYGVTHDLFEAAITHMRISIRKAGALLSKTLATEYATTLQTIMANMKGDLKTMTQKPREHRSYVAFVQRIISLIKVHASDICTVDNFFYRTSEEYSPSVDDPQLQVASLLSYGLRLQEGDARSRQSLFYLLFNNAKFSILSNELEGEIRLLRRALSNQAIRFFIMSKMVPAAISASFAETDAFVLVDLYGEALWLHFTGSTIANELSSEDLQAAQSLLHAFLNGFELLQAKGGCLTMPQLHLIRQITALSNLLWPLLHALSTEQPASQSWQELSVLLLKLWTVYSEAEKHLEVAQISTPSDGRVQASELLIGATRYERKELSLDSDIISFAENVIQDVRKDWTVSQDGIFICSQGNNRQALQTRAVSITSWRMDEIVRDLFEQIQEWCWWWRKTNSGSRVTHVFSDVF